VVHRANPAIAFATLLLASCAGVPGHRGEGAPAAPATPAAPARAGDWERLEPLAPISVALLFHRSSDVPFPEVELAGTLPGVCRVTEPEARKEAFDGAWERLREIDRGVAARRRWLITIPQALGGYDLRRGAFPTGLARDSAPAFSRVHYCGQDGMSYAVALTNWKDFALVAVPEARAREFVRGNGQREATLDLEVEVAGAQPGPPHTLLVRVLRVRLRDAAGGGELADTGVR